MPALARAETARPGEDQAVQSRPSGAVGQRVHEQNGGHRPGESRQRQGEEHARGPAEMDCDHGAEARAGTDAEQARVGHRVSEDRL